MARTTKILTLSVPEEMAKIIDKVAKEENRTRSELLREAMRQYIASKERWREVRSWGRKTAKEQGISKKDIESIIDEFRRNA